MTNFRTHITSTRQLAASIQDARIAKGMTQTELAAATGIPRPWINQLEQCHIANPSFVKVLTIMDALGVKLSVSYAVDPHASDASESERPPSADATVDHSGIAPTRNSPSPALEAFANAMRANPKLSRAYSAILERSRQVEQQARELEGLTDAPTDNDTPADNGEE